MASEARLAEDRDDIWVMRPAALDEVAAELIPLLKRQRWTGEEWPIVERFIDAWNGVRRGQEPER